MQTHRSKSQRASRKQARKYLPMCVCVFIVLIHLLNLVRYARRVYQSSSLTKPTSATYKGEMKAEWVTDIYQSCEDEYSCHKPSRESSEWEVKQQGAEVDEFNYQSNDQHQSNINIGYPFSDTD